MMPAPYSADLRWRVIWFFILSRGQLAVCEAVTVGSLSKHDVDWSENVIWNCHFAFLQSPFKYSKSLCLKMRFNYPGFKLKPALGTRQNWTFVIICSRRPPNNKTGHFTSWRERERLRNVQKRKNARAKREKLSWLPKFPNHSCNGPLY